MIPHQYYKQLPEHVKSQLPKHKRFDSRFFADLYFYCEFLASKNQSVFYLSAHRFGSVYVGKIHRGMKLLIKMGIVEIKEKGRVRLTATTYKWIQYQ